METAIPSDTPDAAAKLSGLEGAGEILSLVARDEGDGEGASRAALARRAGLSRMTLTQRLGALARAGLVRESARSMPSGGRPTRAIELRAEAASLLLADLGETRMRFAVADLRARLLAQRTLPFRVEDGPEAVLSALAGAMEALLGESGAPPFVAGLGLGLPAPVDHRIGRVFGPSVLAGWDDFPIGEWMERRFGAPVAVENDVNLLALFEHRRASVRGPDLFFVKLGTGIGSGIVTEGRLHRGARGAAGDIGHVQFLGPGAPPCRCGKRGCLEARAAGWALARELSRLGHPARDARDVVALLDAGVPEAERLVEAAGRAVGEALGHAVAILNPDTVVSGGTLARAGERILAGIRETVAARCLPLATRELAILAAPPADEACLVGAAHCLAERVFGSGAGAEGFLRRYAGWLAAGAAAPSSNRASRAS